MFLELAETLDCPDCREGYGLVAFVDELTERRVLAGSLGCPLCERRFPIRRGAVELGGSEGVPGERPADEGAPGDPARAELVAALWGLDPDSRGYWALGPSLHGLAEELSERFEALEFLALAQGDAALSLPARFNALLGVAPDSWPVRGHSLRGVAIASPDASSLGEAVRVLGPGARLVVLDPPHGFGKRVEQTGLRVLAADERALVASRS